MRNKYKKGRNDALEQIITKQQKEIENLTNIAKSKDYLIEAQGKESDQYVLICKFLTDILLMLGQLERLLIGNYCVFSLPLQSAIASFKVELSQAMRMIEYNGEDSYTLAPYNDENDD